ncbi:hypothetical protein VNO77_14135 [Canavalia gladiata]|uniref:Uncharacterized protein n=1 Tax=Canavalia gladiata TaxID=3824 RepID=A0AAN9M394_CANGL
MVRKEKIWEPEKETNDEGFDDDGERNFINEEGSIIDENFDNEEDNSGERFKVEGERNTANHEPNSRIADYEPNSHAVNHEPKSAWWLHGSLLMNTHSPGCHYNYYWSMRLGYHEKKPEYDVDKEKIMTLRESYGKRTMKVQDDIFWNMDTDETGVARIAVPGVGYEGNELPSQVSMKIDSFYNMDVESLSKLASYSATSFPRCFKHTSTEAFPVLQSPHLDQLTHAMHSSLPHAYISQPTGSSSSANNRTEITLLSS